MKLPKLPIWITAPLFPFLLYLFIDMALYFLDEWINPYSYGGLFDFGPNFVHAVAIGLVISTGVFVIITKGFRKRDGVIFFIVLSLFFLVVFWLPELF